MRDWCSARRTKDEGEGGTGRESMVLRDQDCRGLKLVAAVALVVSLVGGASQFDNDLTFAYRLEERPDLLA